MGKSYDVIVLAIVALCVEDLGVCGGVFFVIIGNVSQ